VISPQSQTAGNGSPGGVATAYTAAINAGKLSVLCQLVEPSVQATCRQALSGSSNDSSGEQFKNIVLGYVVIDGNQALVGMTGTFCNTHNTPACSTNTDPSAIFSSGKPFATLFSQELDSSNNADNSAYSLFPTIKVGSDWYLDVPAADI
jgi:hypothetical protein